MGGLNETVMEVEPLLSLPMGPVHTMGDNRVGWISNCEDAAPPRRAPVLKLTCCAFCGFCAFRCFNFARASGGTCSACSAFCACYLVCACCARCARSTRFQNLTCNTVGHQSAPPARSVQMVDEGTCSILTHLLLMRISRAMTPGLLDIQHGARQGRNTTTLATKLLNNLHTQDGYVALLDVAKAFPSVPRPMLTGILN